jgi:hypothetical protein
MNKITEIELLAIIKAHRRDSLGVSDGDLSNDRATAMDHYHGRPYGNEMEGRSAVVSKDLSETVDWAMPAIMRIFTQSGNIAEFDPIGPDDEEAAEQESDYTNQVIMRDNNGFMLLHDAIKDALLLKNGYVKHFWEESEKITTEEYSGLTIEELTNMVAYLEADGAEVNIKGQEIREDIVNGMPSQLIDIELHIKRKTGKVCIEAVPPEEIRVSKRCRGSLQSSPFTEHVTSKTRSDLIEMGMDKDFVYSLTAWDATENDAQVRSRDSMIDESDTYGASIYDKSMDEIQYCEAYLKVDWDGDGIAELRKVVTVSDKLPKGEEWNEVIDAVPISGFVSKRVPHRHVGESLDDDLSDLQEMKTVLMRQLFDNVYLTNNQQYAVNERVNLADFMTSTPGGIKRVKGLEPVMGSYEPIMTTPIVGQILPVVDFIENIKENRTGINKSTTGLDPDVLKQSTKGAYMENLNRASQKIEMISRMLAETGVKEMVQQVHSLLIKHQDKARVVRMRGKYVQINPQEWKERTDLVVKVGIGTGNEEDKRTKLMLLAQGQAQLASFGMVGPKQAFAMFTDLAETLGFQTPDKYALDPDTPEFAQAMQQKQQGQQGNQLAEAEQVKGQYQLQMAQQKVQFDGQVQQMKAQFEHEREIMKLQQKASEARADRASREAIEAAKLEFQALIAGYNVDIGQPGLGAGLGDG